MQTETTVLRKDCFDLPDGVLYLDGNSLGPLPKGVSARAAEVISDEWGGQLIGAWNAAGWMDQPGRVGDRIARLIGAESGSVTLGDTLSIKLYQALDAALGLVPERRVVLSDTGNFPSDLYIAKALLASRGQDHRLVTVPPEMVADAITDHVAVVLLTHVDYRTGRMHDLRAITAKAKAVGAVVVWDLAHSAGAVPVDVAASGAAFAVGCTYKYLNGGPGAPGFIHIRPDLVNRVDPALAGWLGHAEPFAMQRSYRPAPGVERMRVGTPPVVQMSMLETALDVWDGLEIEAVRAASVALSERFIAEVEAAAPELVLASPRDPARRGSHVSFRFEHGYAAMQALIARGVIGDFRQPDIMRFGITPLYLDEDDIVRAAAHIAEVMQTEAWRDQSYQIVKRVT